MATTINARCPHCDQLADLAPSEITAFRYRPVEGSFYRYRCPNCSQVAIHPATGVIFQLLRKGHVRIFDVPREHGSGPQIGFDDILDFHFDLEGMTG